MTHISASIIKTIDYSFLVCVCVLVELTLGFDPLSASHQAVFEVRSSADDGAVADNAALDVGPGNRTNGINHISCLCFLQAERPKINLMCHKIIKGYIKKTCFFCLL